MTRKLLLFVGLASLFALQIDSASACQVVGRTSSGERLCMTSSDGPGQPYVDGRRTSGSDFNAQRRWEMIQRRQARLEGARHTQDMASGGTKVGNIVVSPYVPGSQQDKGWQAERKRRGLCGDDRLCLRQ